VERVSVFQQESEPEWTFLIEIGVGAEAIFKQSGFKIVMIIYYTDST